MSRIAHVLRWPALLLGLAIAGTAGCDFFQGSGSGARVSPFLSSLSTTRVSVLCNQDFVVSFDYDDPQNDISLLRVVFQSLETSAVHRVDVLWTPGSGLDLSLSGRARYTYKFDCADPGGRWLITVEVDDLKGHTSNTLTREILLASAG